MKKKYDSPSIQKVSFRYRDQVVAASGDPTFNNPGTESGDITTGGSWSWVEIAQGIWEWIWNRIWG